MQNSDYLTRQEAAEIIGVTAQTITNWYNDGKLPGNLTNKRLYLAKDAVMKLKSTLKDYNIDSNWIKSLKEEQDKVIEEYKSTIQDYKRVIGLLKPANNTGIKVQFLTTILYLGEEDYQLRNREIEIINDLVNGRTFEEISNWNGVSHERIRQIVEKGLRRLRQYTSYDKLYKENQRMKKELDNLKTIMRFSNLPGKGVKKKLEAAEVLNKKITEFGVSTRCINCFENANIVTLGDLVKFGKSKLLDLKNFGKVTSQEVDDLINKIEQDHGLDLTEFRTK